MGGQIMHTKTDERLVYIIGIIGTLAILVLNLKSGFSTDSIWAILKDLAPLAVSILIFKGLFHKPDFKKAANRAIAKVRETHKDIFYESVLRGEKGTEECLFFQKQQPSFIPLSELRKGVLEIRISYGTLANFDDTISPKDSAEEKDNRIVNKQQLVKRKTIEVLQKAGAQFSDKSDDNTKKEVAVKVQFLSNSKYDENLVKVIDNVICLLKES